MKFKVGDKVTVFSYIQYQLPIFKECEVTAYPVKIGHLENCVEIKAANGIVRVVAPLQCKPIKEEQDDQSKN